MSYELAYSPQDYEGNPLFEIRDEKDYMVLHTAIVADVDILITHGPALGILDQNMAGIYCGSNSLKNRVQELQNLKLHIFGHIHESRGTKIQNNKLFVNAAICGIPYTDVIYNPITVEI